MIIVHHLENSRSQRVLWLLEEMGLEYEVKLYKRDKKTNLAPPELKAVHPLGKSPVISDGNVVVAETGAILEYLLDTYGQGRFRPETGTQAARDHVYWMYFAEGSAMMPLLLKLITDNMAKRSPFLVRPIIAGAAKRIQGLLVNQTLKDHFELYDRTLSVTGWFAGAELSAADVMMSFPLEAASVRAGAKSYKNIKAFLDRIHAREAYQRALKRGGPYAYA